MLSGHSVGTYMANELTRNLSGNARPQSSQLAKTLWTDLGLKSETGARELISTKKKKKKPALPPPVPKRAKTWHCLHFVPIVTQQQPRRIRKGEYMRGKDT